MHEQVVFDRAVEGTAPRARAGAAAVPAAVAELLPSSHPVGWPAAEGIGMDCLCAGQPTRL